MAYNIIFTIKTREEKSWYYIPPPLIYALSLVHINTIYNIQNFVTAKKISVGMILA